MLGYLLLLALGGFGVWYFFFRKKGELAGKLPGTVP
jgi:hypothetical protein